MTIRWLAPASIALALGGLLLGVATWVITGEPSVEVLIAVIAGAIALISGLVVAWASDQGGRGGGESGAEAAEWQRTRRFEAQSGARDLLVMLSLDAQRAQGNASGPPEPDVQRRIQTLVNLQQDLARFGPETEADEIDNSFRAILAAHPDWLAWKISKADKW